MNIADRADHDPVADLHIVDAYMRWALLSAEEGAGKPSLTAILRGAGLERFVDSYPPEDQSQRHIHLWRVRHVEYGVAGAPGPGGKEHCTACGPDFGQVWHRKAGRAVWPGGLAGR